MRRWKLALSLALIAGAGIWLLALPLNRPEPTGIDGASPSLPSFAGIARAAARQALPRVVPQPNGAPEFSAAFTGSRLNTAVWGTCYPTMNVPQGCTNFGNREFEWYLPSQIRVSGGVLRFVAQPKATAGRAKDGSPKEYSCRSGMVTTYPSLRFRYGYLQVVARIPAQRPLWPALWLAAANGSWPPEIDILESWGRGTSAAFFHPVGASQVKAKIPAKLAIGWHAFALSWTRSKLTWFVDGRQILTVRRRIPHQKMYFIADLAAYGRAGQCNGSLLIRSVKLWKN